VAGLFFRGDLLKALALILLVLAGAANAQLIISDGGNSFPADGEVVGGGGAPATSYVGTYEDPPDLHERALRMGVNLFVYAVTSRPGS
jgi:hypothetical protein